jgi:hypothetical protein
MWPFARSAKKPAETAPERQELPSTQLGDTLQYGWKGESPDDVKEGLRRLLKEHKDDPAPAEESPPG